MYISKFIGRIRLYWWHVMVLVGLLAMTAFYASYKLTESPPTWFDEGVYIQVAQSLSERGVQTIQTAPGVLAPTGNVTGGYPFLAPIALSLHYSQNMLLGARLPMVFFILLCVGLTFFLMYTLFGMREALLATFLLSSFPLLYGGGKDVMGEVPGMCYLLLTLFFVWNIEATNFINTRWWLLAGLCAGLTAATKPIFFLFLIAVGIIFLLRARAPWRIGSLLWAMFACAVPLVLWGYLQFGSADAFASIAHHYANPYEESSVIATSLHNATKFFTESTPIYFAVLMVVWIVASVMRLCRKEKVSFAESIALVFSLLITLAYLRTAGWYRYFFEAMILALVFAPASLRVIAAGLLKKISLPGYVSVVSVLCVVLGCIQVYQLNFDSWVAEHYASDQTKTFVDYFAHFPITASVLVYDAPEIVPFLPSDNYYQYLDIEPTQKLAYGKENIPLLEQGVPEYVIIPPHNHEQQKNLFTKYVQTDSVGSYLVLTRR